jgi:hypothetical protein
MSKLGLFLATVMCSSSAWAATPFDGNYQGVRNLKLPAAPVCRETTISATVANGQVTMTLAYNGTRLSGRLDSSGSGVMTGVGPGGRYTYRFAGRVRGNTFSGTWSVNPPDCSGTWALTRV